MRCIVKLVVNPLVLERTDELYLKSLYPCTWTTFISDAMGFPTIEDAKMQINQRHYQLISTLKNPEDINKLVIDCYENGKIIGHDFYLRRD